MTRFGHDFVNSGYLDLEAQEALKQGVTVGKDGEAAYKLSFGPLAQRVTFTRTSCMHLRITPAEGIIAVAQGIGSSVVMVSPAGEPHEGEKTVTEVIIKPHTHYTLTGVTDAATARMTGEIDLDHLVVITMFLLEPTARAGTYNPGKWWL